MEIKGFLNRIRTGRIFGEARLAFALFLLLLIVNILLNPARYTPSHLGTTIGLVAPLILAAVAVTPIILSGGGGIDISIGPLMTLVNVIIVQVVLTNWGQTSPLVVIPIALFLGVLSGLFNGFLVVVVRLQPIVATLGTYLIYSGLAVWIMPSPGGSIPAWMARFSKSWSVIPLIAVYVIWLIIYRSLFYEQLMATGGDDRAAYTSGINVSAVRIGAYVLTGIFGAIGALSLGALIGSGDPKVGAGYTMTAIAGAALGGVSLAGGIGGIVGATFGAIDIFLIQSILTYYGVSPFALRVAFGTILVLALMLNSPETVKLARRLTGRVAHVR
jgi:ribose transport system permease protein